MNTGITKLFTCFAFIFVTTMIWTGQAVAKLDGKFYPGLMCTNQYGPTAPGNPTGYTYKGAIYNSHLKRAANVRCAMIKDELGIKNITVYYTDNHPTQQLTCTLEIHKANASRSRLRRVVKSSPKGTKTGKLSFGERGVIWRAFGPTYYSMTCTLPPVSSPYGQSSLHSYSVTEWKR